MVFALTRCVFVCVYFARLVFKRGGFPCTCLGSLRGVLSPFVCVFVLEDGIHIQTLKWKPVVMNYDFYCCCNLEK